MDNLEKYKKYREALRMMISTKIVPYINTNAEENVVLESAKILGMVDENGNIAPQKDDEMMYLLDFSLNEYKINGKNMIQMYKENVEPENDIEEEILNALAKSYLSLFRVINIVPAKGLVFLKDVFDRVKNVRLTDLEFSENGNTESAIFTRVLPFEGFNMSSGMTGIFQDILVDSFVKSYNTINSELKIEGEFDTESVSMSRVFFQLNRGFGNETQYDW